MSDEGKTESKTVNYRLVPASMAEPEESIPEDAKQYWQAPLCHLVRTNADGTEDKLFLISEGALDTMCTESIQDYTWGGEKEGDQIFLFEPPEWLKRTDVKAILHVGNDADGDIGDSTCMGATCERNYVLYLGTDDTVCLDIEEGYWDGSCHADMFGDFSGMDTHLYEDWKKLPNAYGRVRDDIDLPSGTHREPPEEAPVLSEAVLKRLCGE
jgi:hypothetical protein